MYSEIIWTLIRFKSSETHLFVKNIIRLKFQNKIVRITGLFVRGIHWSPAVCPHKERNMRKRFHLMALSSLWVCFVIFLFNAVV